MAISFFFVHAQENTQDEELLDLSLEELLDLKITTPSKKSEKISHAPGTIYLISKQDIIDRGYANLKDIFQDLPGMNGFEYSYAEQGTVVPIRGVLGNEKFIVLLNGIRVNPAGGEEFKLNSDFSIRGAKQIEVVYGPGSTLYGQDGISAIINVITEEAEDHTELEVQAIGGPLQHTEGYANFSTPFVINGEKKGAITVMLQYTNTNLDDRSKTNPDWNNQFSTVNGLAEQVRFDQGFSGFLKISSGKSSLQFFHRESKRSSSDGGFGDVLYFQPEAFWHDRSTNLEARNVLDFSDKTSLESSISYNRYEIDPDSRFVFTTDPTKTAFHYDDYKYAIGSRIDLEEKFSWNISDKFSVVSGLSIVSSDILPKATVPGQADPSADLVSQAGTWDYITSDGDTVSIQRVNNILFQQYGAYSELQIKPIDRLSISLGLRGDASTLFDKKPLSPRGAVIFNATENLVAKYMYSQAYVIPAPYFGYATAYDGLNLITLNKNVEPETMMSHEVNLFYFKNNFTLSLSGYYNQQENMILIGENATSANVLDEQIIYLGNGQNARLTQTVNQGSSKTYGLDLSSKVKHGNASFWGSYSYVNGSVHILGQDTSILDQNRISAHNVRLGVSYNFFHRLTATLSGKLSSTPKGIKGHENIYGLSKELKMPYQINLHANYIISPHFRAFLNIKNLTNHVYAMRGVRDPVLAETIKGTLGLSFTL